jgi:hypothetical protein
MIENRNVGTIGFFRCELVNCYNHDESLSLNASLTDGLHAALFARAWVNAMNYVYGVSKSG